MTDITNAQLMNAIKLLTRKVESLEQKLEAVQTKSVKRTDYKEYTQLDETVAKAVVESPNLKTAAQTLDTSEGRLKKVLQESGIPHLLYEPWSLAVERSIKGTPVVDDYEYPEVIARNHDVILKKLPDIKIGDIAHKLQVPMKVLARYVWKCGYSTKGEWVGKPDFIIEEVAKSVDIPLEK